ncbi:hypothetical protein VNO77_19161 [Canavalia gladiata]|uniref:Uncharacterized protein n=1 Tax=Canavalia gladiata TaxID=3824 RepID=A0AAN9LM59_CANGL
MPKLEAQHSGRFFAYILLSRNKKGDLWRIACQNAWGNETTHVLETVSSARRLGWGRLARELTILEAAAWRRLTVGGIVHPSRCSFSACAVGYGRQGLKCPNHPMQNLSITSKIEVTVGPTWYPFAISLKANKQAFIKGMGNSHDGPVHHARYQQSMQKLMGYKSQSWKAQVAERIAY